MKLRPESLLELLQPRRVLVIGDAIVDLYLTGRIARVSREAPVLILEYMHETMHLGGACNAAANVQSLGGRAVLLGMLGDDQPGRAARSLAAERGIDANGLFCVPGQTSCTKTRILASGEHTVTQQLLRIDRLPAGAAGMEAEARLAARLDAALPDAEAVILSDYGLGTLSAAFYQRALRAAVAAGLPVVVDSRCGLLNFFGATLLTPNVAEVEAAIGRRLRDEEDLSRAGWGLYEHLRPEALLITRGPEGMSLFERDGRLTHIPAANRLEVFDVSGAGDTVVAAAAMGLAAGLSMEIAARLANHAAGVVVRKLGTATVTPGELYAAIRSAESSEDDQFGLRYQGLGLFNGQFHLTLL